MAPDIFDISPKMGSILGPPFFHFRALGSQKGGPRRIGGHLLAPREAPEAQKTPEAHVDSIQAIMSQFLSFWGSMSPSGLDALGASDANIQQESINRTFFHDGTYGDAHQPPPRLKMKVALVSAAASVGA